MIDVEKNKDSSEFFQERDERYCKIKGFKTAFNLVRKIIKNTKMSCDNCSQRYELGCPVHQDLQRDDFYCNQWSVKNEN